MRKIVFISIFLFWCIVAFPQTFTLTDCINYAHNHRIELQKQQTDEAYYRKSHTYSIYGLLPSLSGKADYQLTEKQQKQTDKSGTLSLSSEWVLFNGLQTINALKQSKLLKERSKTQTEKIRNDIQLEITEIFYTLLLAQENIKIAENSIQSAEQQIALISEIVRAGKKSNIDLLEMQAQQEKNKSNRINAKKQYEQTFIRLKKAMNYAENLTFSIVDSKTSFSMDLGNLRFLPEFQLAKQDSLFAVYDLRKIKGQYAPYLTLFGSLSSQYQDFNNYFKNQISDNFAKNIGVSLVVPIYSKHEIRKRQVEKEKQLADILLDNKQLHNDISFEIERIKEEITQNEENIKSVEKHFDYCKQIYEMRKEQYRHCVLSITDLLIAENNVKNAELELVYEQYNLQYNLRLIEFYCGKM